MVFGFGAPLRAALGAPALWLHNDTQENRVEPERVVNIFISSNKPELQKLFFKIKLPNTIGDITFFMSRPAAQWRGPSIEPTFGRARSVFPEENRNKHILKLRKSFFSPELNFFIYWYTVSSRVSRAVLRNSENGLRYEIKTSEDTGNTNVLERSTVRVVFVVF